MKETSFILVGILFAVSIMVSATTRTLEQAPTVEELWSIPMEIVDLEVSNNGNYIVATNGSALYYFEAGDPDPLWWFIPPWFEPDEYYFTSVAISADGNHVAVGNSTGYIGYFANARNLRGSVADATWWSIELGGEIEPKALDISADGEYVVVGGTGENLYYFTDCISRSGPNQTPSWSDYPGSYVCAVDMSADGKYVAVAGGGPSGFVAFYKDADTQPYPAGPSWRIEKDNEIMNDVKVSDDGYAVAAVSTHLLTLRYWANASTLTGEPLATWKSYGFFFLVDLSSDGDKVIAAGFKNPLNAYPCLYFWSEARSLTETPEENWTALQQEKMHVKGAAISDDGSIVAATISVYTDKWNYYVCFFTSNGTLIGNFTLNISSPLVSISEDGSIVAVGGPGWDSLHVYKITKPIPPTPVGGIILPDKDHAPPASLIATLAILGTAAIAIAEMWLRRRKP